MDEGPGHDFFEDVYSRDRPPQHKTTSLSSTQAAAGLATDRSVMPTVASADPNMDFPAAYRPASNESILALPDSDPATVSNGSSDAVLPTDNPIAQPNIAAQVAKTTSLLEIRMAGGKPIDDEDIFRWIGQSMPPGWNSRRLHRSPAVSIKPGPRSKSSISEASFTSGMVPVTTNKTIADSVRNSGSQFVYDTPYVAYAMENEDIGGSESSD